MENNQGTKKRKSSSIWGWLVLVLFLGLFLGVFMVRPAIDALAAKIDGYTCPEPPIGSGFVLSEDQYVQNGDNIIIYRCAWSEGKEIVPLSPQGK